MPSMKYQSIKQPGLVVDADQEEGDIAELCRVIIPLFRIEMFVELGTKIGGLTLAVHEAHRRIWIRSFDQYVIEDPDVLEVAKNQVPSETPAPKSAFSPAYVEFHKADFVEDRPIELIACLQSHIRKLLYVDGYDKPKEAKLWADYLQPFDLIGAHDYSTQWTLDNMAFLKDLGFEPVLHQRQDEQPRSFARYWVRVAPHGTFTGL